MRGCLQDSRWRSRRRRSTPNAGRHSRRRTSQRRWSLADLPDNVQLTAYSYAYQMLFGRPVRELKLVNLVRTKHAVIEMKAALDNEKIANQDDALRSAAGQAFYNTSPFLLRDLKGRATQQKNARCQSPSRWISLRRRAWPVGWPSAS